MELVCDSRGLFVSARHLQDGNAFWEGGAELAAAIAKRFLQLGQLDVAVDRLEPLRANGKLSTEGASVLAAAYCQRVMNQCASPAARFRWTLICDTRSDICPP